MARAFRHLLMGFRVEVLPVSGAKETRADPLSAQMNAGSVRVLRGVWNRDFLEELRGFPRGRHDDQVDAASDAFNALAMRRKGRGA
jgi:predicted phage terminase large subunit-like protein